MTEFACSNPIEAWKFFSWSYFTINKLIKLCNCIFLFVFKYKCSYGYYSRFSPYGNPFILSKNVYCIVISSSLRSSQAQARGSMAVSDQAVPPEQSRPTTASLAKAAITLLRECKGCPHQPSAFNLYWFRYVWVRLYVCFWPELFVCILNLVTIEFVWCFIVK